MKAYVAGKITGLKWSLVVNKFSQAKFFLNSIGYDAIIPTEITDDPNADWNESIKLCIKNLVDCDILVLLEDWFNSKGAKIEHNLALTIGLPIYKLIITKNGYILRGFFEFNVTEASCIALDLSLEEIKCDSRKREYVDARRIIAKYLSDNFKHMSWQEIGIIINRDHASAMHLSKTANNFLKYDKGFTAKYNKVIALL